MSQYPLRAVVVVVLLVVYSIISFARPQNALAQFSCSNALHDVLGADGASSSTDTNVDGAKGSVYVPAWTDQNLHGQYQTAADVAMIMDDDVQHFFQIGWYIGSNSTGLPYTTVPLGFVGEGLFSNGSETTSPITGVSLTSGWHTFQVNMQEDSRSPWYLHYYGFLDGVQRWISTMSSAVKGRPRMVAETNFDCPDMLGYASTASLGQGLWGKHQGGSWSSWQEHYNQAFGEPYIDPGCWLNQRINNQPATVYVIDVC